MTAYMQAYRRTGFTEEVGHMPADIGRAII